MPNLSKQLRIDQAASDAAVLERLATGQHEHIQREVRLLVDAIHLAMERLVCHRLMHDPFAYTEISATDAIELAIEKVASR